MLFLLQVGRLPNQGPKGLQLGAASRMLEVTDCGTAVHHVQDMHQASTLRDHLPTHDREPNNNNNNKHQHQPPPGQAGWSGSMQVGLFPLFPRATPTSQQPGARLMTR